MQNHELLVFYCGHQSKVHRQKWVSTNRQLIVANLIYITCVYPYQITPIKMTFFGIINTIRMYSLYEYIIVVETNKAKRL